MKSERAIATVRTWSEAVLSRLTAIDKDDARKIGLPAAMIVAAASHVHVPAESFVKIIYQLVLITGVPVALLALFATTVRGRSTLRDLMVQVARSGAVFMSAIWLLGHFGDAVYRGVIESPQESAAMGVTCLVLWRIARAAWTQASVSTTDKRHKPTSRDLQRIAVHESGHALTYAALGFAPQQLRAVIHHRASDVGTLGMVSCAWSPHLMPDRAHVEWYMLHCLAGERAEKSIEGAPSLSSERDHALWFELAKPYLTNQCRGLYFVKPNDEIEIAHNLSVLEALQREHAQILDEFFELNRKLLVDLADCMRSKRKLNRSEISPFLARTVIPYSFPRPFGMFVEFSLDRDEPPELGSA